MKNNQIMIQNAQQKFDEADLIDLARDQAQLKQVVKDWIDKAMTVASDNDANELYQLDQLGALYENLIQAFGFDRVQYVMERIDRKTGLTFNVFFDTIIGRQGSAENDEVSVLAINTASFMTALLALLF